MLAIAILASIVLIEFALLFILLMVYDGLEGAEIWIGINQWLVILLVVSSAVGFVVWLWTLAL